jgi:hypothetical protein
MSGPKTPYGYAPIFHDALAAITLESPAELDIDTGKHPAHLRSQFNQFRQSWINQAAIHHKRKEFQQEKACRQNYYRLMQYECRLTATGIILAARGNIPGVLRVRGRANISTPLELDDIKDLENVPTSPFSTKEYTDQEIRDIFATVPVIEKPAPIIKDNPPKEPMSNKYGIPIGPPKDWNKTE